MERQTCEKCGRVMRLEAETPDPKNSHGGINVYVMACDCGHKASVQQRVNQGSRYPGLP